MSYDPRGTHLSDDELLRAADGELRPFERVRVERHLQACWTCRERMQSLESTIADFVRARNRDLDGRLPDQAGPRALLRARLAEVAQSSPAVRYLRFATPSFGRLAAGAAGSVVFLAILAMFAWRLEAGGPKPRLAVTPGEVRPISLSEVCEYPRAEVISRDIPQDKQRQVFALYGLKWPPAGEYEVDYLITPDLGGTESIRNLWPQPYSAKWNARVKDRLEERLHELVCTQRLDLETAQRAIAADWIGAYKKYVGESADQ